MVELINATDVPSSNGHYSHASVIDHSVYVSAQLPETSNIHLIDIDENIARQTQSVLFKILAITKEAEGSIRDIAYVRFYITNMDYWQIIDREFKKFMGSHMPARAVICVSEIKNNCMVMAEAICYLHRYKVTL